MTRIWTEFPLLFWNTGSQITYLADGFQRHKLWGHLVAQERHVLFTVRIDYLDTVPFC